MNLVFIGASKFGLRCLSSCIEMPELNVTGIVTSPQSFAISYRPSGVTNVLHADLVRLAGIHSIPVRMLELTMNEPGLFETVSKWKPDAFLVAGWYHMIPKRWRQLAPAYGLHASLLPDYCGGAPLVWAMINGEPKTGITLFQMDDGVDSGPIAGQQEEPILPNDTIATLYARIEERGLALLRGALPLLANNSLKLHKQDESRRRIVTQRSPEDGLIDWSQNAESVDRFIRAQTKPYPGAFTTLADKPVHIWRTQVVQATNDHPNTGCVERTKEGAYTLACGIGAVIINEITYEQRTYTQTQLAEVFGGGGQRLGGSSACLMSCAPC